MTVDEKENYWYEQEAALLEAEKQLMNNHFPSFNLDRLDDGRICWIRTVAPIKDDWTLLVVYDNDHPNTKWGPSVKSYIVDPDLESISADLGRGLPHTIRDGYGNLHISFCINGITNKNKIVTATAAVMGTVKWIVAFELWLKDKVSDDCFF